MSNNIVLTSNKLFAAEEWDVIFNAFRNININPFDYDTVYSALLSYIKANNPEEYRAYTTNGVMKLHLDLFSRLAHAISYRYEKVTRENFFDSVSSRESVIDLARIFSYQPKRNRAANGQCKIVGVRTSEVLYDREGNNISGTTVKWGDMSDTRWYEKYVRILNAALSSTNPVGRPLERETFYNVRHELYPVDRVKTSSITPKFKAKVNGTSYSFEAVSSKFGDVVEEATPNPFSTFNLIYKNDSGGNMSPNTGFFVQFKQGELQNQDFTFTDPLVNRTIDIEEDNINETDVWFCEVHEDGHNKKVWKKIDSMEGQNLIYEKTFHNNDSMYTVTSRDGNQITFKFGDGLNGKIPYGSFRAWYRVSENERFIIRRHDIQSVPITIPYSGKDGETYQLTLYLTNEQQIDNAEPEESHEAIRRNAPLSHYTQERMINGEDYNVYPQIHTSLIRKTKTVNRTHHGHSRYMDIYDRDNVISKITLLAEDGFFYALNQDMRKQITPDDGRYTVYEMMDDVKRVIENKGFKNYLYSTIDNDVSLDTTIIWRTLPSQNVFYDRGYFSVDGEVQLVGKNSSISALKTINDKSLIIVNDDQPVRMQYAENDGYVNPEITPVGTVKVSEYLQDGSLIKSIIPHIEVSEFTIDMFDKFAKKITNKESFSIYYRVYEGEFVEDDSDSDSVFIQNYTFMEDDQGGYYEVRSPNLVYMIGSENDIQFYHKYSQSVVLDPVTGEPIQDYVSIGAENVLSDVPSKPTFLMKRDKTKDITIISKDNGDW